jgi:2-haloacid dehalogenase
MTKSCCNAIKLKFMSKQLPGLYIFDAYGTLFDIHAAVRHFQEKLGDDARKLSAIWRRKQLEYSWVRALAGRYKDFWALTEEALDTAFAKVPTADKRYRQDLLDIYARLDCYSEVPFVLKALKERDIRLAILSNGTAQMLQGAVDAAHIGHLLDEVISVDNLKTYKTSPDVYDLITTHFRVFPDNVSYQSSNRWDIAGGKAHGFRCVWINRDHQPDEYKDLMPDAVLPSLEGLLNI